MDAAQELTEGCFELLAPRLSRERQGVSAADVARQLGTTESTVNVIVHRLRRRYREVLQGVVLRTVDSPTEVPEELRYLPRDHPQIPNIGMGQRESGGRQGLEFE